MSDPGSGRAASDRSGPEAGATIALALSGGGSRAIAFHLGCLRALHSAGLLERVEVISAVSGGSVIAALYCHTPGDFAAFEAKTRSVLARGFLKPAIGKSVKTLEGMKALVIFTSIAAERLCAFAVGRLLALLRVKKRAELRWLRQSIIPRRASRTTILRRVFSEIFQSAKLSALRAERPKLIVVACELQTKSAFYFAADGVGSWRFGRASGSNLEIADAVSASAAYPAALPAIDRRMKFTKDAQVASARVILTDGGVYDNLGLAPLWPDRDEKVSLHVGRFRRIIACRAGYGLAMSPAPSLAPSRLTAAFESVFARAQNYAVKRLFDLKDKGEIEGFLLPYLGQQDARLAHAPDDFVTGAEAAGYPTDFSAMKTEWIDKLARRGEQLTLALLKEHWADFLEREAPQTRGSPVVPSG